MNVLHLSVPPHGVPQQNSLHFSGSSGRKTGLKSYAIISYTFC